MARVGAELARDLADSLIIPFNVSDYAWQLEEYRLTLDTDYGTALRAKIPHYGNTSFMYLGFVLCSFNGGMLLLLFLFIMGFLFLFLCLFILDFFNFCHLIYLFISLK